MPLLTYQEARPWAKAIKQAVLVKKMPPWFADPAYGHFSNDRRLSDADIKTLVAWVDAVRRKAIAKDKPKPVDGWKAGTSESRTTWSRCRSNIRFRPLASSTTPISSFPADSRKTSG